MLQMAAYWAVLRGAWPDRDRPRRALLDGRAKTHAAAGRHAFSRAKACWQRGLTCAGSPYLAVC
jgi:hypothetical protein